MGMYATKSTAEDSHSLSTKWLKAHDYFCGYNSGGIKWTSGFGNESSVGFTVEAMGDFPYIRFQYSTGSRWSEEKRSMDYKFPLIKVPCNLGGFRWAFQCSFFKNGIYCGRTVYTLYQSNSDYFGCRHCMNIVYKSQRESGGGGRFEYLGKLIDVEQKMEELYKSIKRQHYRGKITKKYLKYLHYLDRHKAYSPLAFVQLKSLRRMIES